MAYRRIMDPTASAAALFGHKLRKLRDSRGWTQEALADRVGCTLDMISKIEVAKRAATLEMADKFDRIFGTDDYFHDLQPLVFRELGGRSMPPFLEAEAAAAMLHVYDPALVTGLFQTEEYASLILGPGKSAAEGERLVARRLGRQNILDRPEPPWLVLVQTEYAIRRTIGGAHIMRSQLQRLLDGCGRDNIAIQVIPESAPVYMPTSFTLMSFADGSNAAYTESALIPGGITKESRYVDMLRIRWDIVRAAALSATASQNLMQTILDDL